MRNCLPAQFLLTKGRLMKFHVFLGLFALCALPCLLNAGTLPDPATKDKVPPIAYVQGMIWKRLDLADFYLTGIIRTTKDKKRYPVILRTRGHEMVYEFQDQPLQIRVQLDPGVFTVQRRSKASEPWVTITGDELKKSIFDTNITFEDLG